MCVNVSWKQKEQALLVKDQDTPPYTTITLTLRVSSASSSLLRVLCVSISRSATLVASSLLVCSASCMGCKCKGVCRGCKGVRVNKDLHVVEIEGHCKV